MDGNGYVCQCFTGFTGTQCESNINWCQASNIFGNQPICLNNATCINQLNQYTCSCLAGYTGVRCETLVDFCATQPCTRGNCTNLPGGNFKCTCPLGIFNHIFILKLHTYFTLITYS